MAYSGIKLIGAWLVIVLAVALIGTCVTGCSGVLMNAEASSLLDRTAALSESSALQAEAGKMTPEQMTDALRGNANMFHVFRALKKGQKPIDPIEASQGLIDALYESTHQGGGA